MLQGDTKRFAATAKQRSIAYLERNLDGRGLGGYDLAITTLALTLVGSDVADLAYSKLMAAARTVDGMLYWSDTPIETNR